MGQNLDTTASADVRVVRVDSVYRAELRLVSSTGLGARMLQHADCAALADSVALVYALAASRSAEAPSLRWTFTLYVTGMLGTLPSLAGGGRVALGMEWSSLRVELAAAAMGPQTAALRDSNLSGRFELATASIGASVPLTLGALEVAPGLGVDAYHISATGLGGESSRTGRSLGVGPSLSLLIRLRPSDRWAFAAFVIGVVPIVRSRFVFTDAGILHQVPPMTGSMGLGLELRH